jgi:hypothetical protein
MQANAANAGQVAGIYQQGVPAYQQGAAGAQNAAGSMLANAGNAGAVANMYNQGAPVYQQAAGMAQNAAGAMQGLNQTAGQNYGFLSNAADVANNPYVQSMLQANERSATDWLKNTALPQIQGSAQSVNALGSDRMGLAQGQAAGQAHQNLLNQNAQTMMGAYQQGLGAQQNALGQTGNMLQNQMAPAGAYGQAGAYHGMAGNLGQQAYGMGQQGATDQMAAANWMGQGGAMQGLAGNLAQQAYGANQQGALDQMTAAGWLGQGGQVVQGYQQAALQDQINRFNYMYQEPQARLANSMGYFNLMQPLGTQTGQQYQPNPNYVNPYQAGMGGAMMGFGAYNTGQQQGWW